MENTSKNSVFNRAQLLCITDNKETFRGPCPKWQFCNQKCHFGFSPVPAETPTFVSLVILHGHKKHRFPKQIVVNENARFFTFRTQIMFADFSKKWHFNKNFVHDHQKTQFSGFVKNFLSIFPCLSFSNEKQKHFLENPFFTPRQTAISKFTPLHTICDFYGSN